MEGQLNAQFSNLQLMGILLGLTMIFAVLSLFIFRWQKLNYNFTIEILPSGDFLYMHYLFRMQSHRDAHLHYIERSAVQVSQLHCIRLQYNCGRTYRW